MTIWTWLSVGLWTSYMLSYNVWFFVLFCYPCQYHCATCATRSSGIQSIGHWISELCYGIQEIHQTKSVFFHSFIFISLCHTNTCCTYKWYECAMIDWIIFRLVCQLCCKHDRSENKLFFPSILLFKNAMNLGHSTTMWLLVRMRALICALNINRSESDTLYWCWFFNWFQFVSVNYIFRVVVLFVIFVFVCILSPSPEKPWNMCFSRVYVCGCVIKVGGWCSVHVFAYKIFATFYVNEIWFYASTNFPCATNRQKHRQNEKKNLCSRCGMFHFFFSILAWRTITHNPNHNEKI